MKLNDSYVKFFPVGNGDTVLIKKDETTIITDINYRESGDDIYDIAPEIQKVCRKKLNIFVLTHPDADHLRGFSKLFYTGDPDRWDKNSGLILVRELWVNPYAVKPNYETEESKDLLKEITRRNKLKDKSEGKLEGNRIKVLSLNQEETHGEIALGIYWELLAPSAKETNIPKSKHGDQPSCNDSSLVIRWEVTIEGTPSYVILGGDAGVNVWERIWDDNEYNKKYLQWHILLAPHHCSGSTLARKNVETGEYKDSKEAKNALSQKIDYAHIVSSSQEIKNDEDPPPSYKAKRKYLEILRIDEDDRPEDRFHCTTTHKNKKESTVTFIFTNEGPELFLNK